MTAAGTPAHPRSLTPAHRCAQCGQDAWAIQRSFTSERTVHFRRVRIYLCGGCNARLYTHEEVCEAPADPGRRLMSAQSRLEVHPCDCGCESFAREAFAPPGLWPFHFFRYTCRQCGAKHWTRELYKGETPAPVPRNERGKRPHPYR